MKERENREKKEAIKIRKIERGKQKEKIKVERKKGRKKVERKNSTKDNSTVTNKNEIKNEIIN